MNPRCSMTVLLVAAVILLSWTEVTCSRDTQHKLPLLFGRRGMNPNMNSLFFGKRSDIPAAYDEDELCSLCRAIRTSCNSVYVKENLLELAEEP